MRVQASSTSAFRSGAGVAVVETSGPACILGRFRLFSTLCRGTTSTRRNGMQLGSLGWFGSILPETKAPFESIGVVACSAFRRHGLQMLNIAAAENDVIRFEGRCEFLDY